MRTISLVTALMLAFATPAQAGDDMVAKKSPHSVSRTLDRLTATLESKGVTVFARIDHAAGAVKAGKSLRPTEVLIFGNPQLGTPLMAANQRIGLDLPLKVLAWEDDKGRVWLGYLEPEALEERYDIKDRDDIFKKITGALDNFTDAAIKAE